MHPKVKILVGVLKGIIFKIMLLYRVLEDYKVVTKQIITFFTINTTSSAAPSLHQENI